MSKKVILAHPAAGYLITAFWESNVNKPDRFGLESWQLYCVGFVAASLPDVDMVYQLIFDPREVSHRLYWSHTPIYWLAIFLLVLSFLSFFGKKVHLYLARFVSVQVFAHLVLDSVVGGLRWFFPWSAQRYGLVPSLPGPYAERHLRILFHWTFLFEVVIIVAALCYFMQRQKRADEAIESSM